MSSLRRRFAPTLLAGSLSVGVLASSSVFAQEAGEEPAAGEIVALEVPEFIVEEAPPIELVFEEGTPVDFVQIVPEIAAAPEPILPAATAEPTPAPTALPQVTATATPAPAPAANKLGVSVIDNRFQPTALTISPGTTITWTNNGNNIHTLTSADGMFDSGGLMAGASFSFTFDKAGTYRLICRQHGLNGMFGSIVVQ